MLTGAFLLACRMAIVAAIVLAISAVVGRAGPFLGAMLASIPISAGPAYVFLALDHDAAFLANSTVASILSVGATGPFVWAYCVVSRRAGTIPSIGAAIAALVATVFVTNLFDWTFPGAFVWSATLIGGSFLATGFARRAAVRVALPNRRIDLLVRAGAVMTVVAAVSILGELAGPVAAGYGALMPVVFLSLIIVLQPRVGAAPVAGIVSHALAGIGGFVPALSVVHLTALPLGSAMALSLGLATSLAWNGGLILLRRWRTAR
ncbi:hypothetical protein [Enterovirga rhinocerotis]|uniref:Uncharacterized protein n=1 Tax=Enterovirga rhinocerotis TaxID=1339210 RepID=A0A4R7CCU9_9HYPH|nr:hypothetical protein [Enterovirga rhinocerotis]TDR94647.1 hypothetical protein EV668_1935 [Enterovirga rhinocerotis]